MQDFDVNLNKGANILFISPCLPYPLDNGLKIRAFHTIKELLSKGHKVTLLCFTKENDKEHLQNLKKNLDIQIVNVKLKEELYGISHIFYTIFSRYPFYMKSLFKKEFKNELKSLIQDRSY
ncbi:MAG: hypothetical protein K8E24_004410 [Methanobacterium paludis]|nr:hypothetical protein [Methanobacterium paludis]